MFIFTYYYNTNPRNFKKDGHVDNFEFGGIFFMCVLKYKLWKITFSKI
jgi:hypothetical protein